MKKLLFDIVCFALLAGIISSCEKEENIIEQPIEEENSIGILVEKTADYEIRIVNNEERELLITQLGVKPQGGLKGSSSDSYDVSYINPYNMCSYAPSVGDSRTTYVSIWKDDSNDGAYVQFYANDATCYFSHATSISSTYELPDNASLWVSLTCNISGYSRVLARVTASPYPGGTGGMTVYW